MSCLGALALYELPSVILGVGPAAPGYEKIKVHPVPGYLNQAKGEAVTPKGKVWVEWSKGQDGRLSVVVKAKRQVMESVVRENGVEYVAADV